jgi:hypothetical protein
MIARIIENWLINTNERFIRPAFCQLLLNEGHTVKNIHGNLEHGKDIISIDSNGYYHAYQLKKGDIDTNTWREIEPQINELVEYSIDHIGFDPEKNHIPYLVISGTINSPVNNKIRLYNQAHLKRDYSKLEIIDKNELVKRFRESQGKFIPKDFDDFYTFLDLLTLDGKDFLPKERFIGFLNKIIFNEVPHYRYDKINAISSSLIFISYLLESFQHAENYYALFEAWILLAGCIIRFGIKADLEKEEFESSLELVMENVIQTLNLLKDEIIIKREFFEGEDAFDSSSTYGARVVIVLGTLACLELYNHRNEEYDMDIEFLELVKEKVGNALFWGESAFPYYFYLIKYLEVCNEKELSDQLLEEIFSDIIGKNSINSKKGLPNVYYDVNVVIESLIREDMENYIKENQFLSDTIQANVDKIILPFPYKSTIKHGLRSYLKGSQIANITTDIKRVNDEVFDELSKENNSQTDIMLLLSVKNILKYSNLKKIDYRLFLGSSYILETIILMLSRRDKRQILTENWKKLSHIKFEQLKLDNIEDTFIYYTKDGFNEIIIPNKSQSWYELLEEAISNGDFPGLYEEFFDILMFYIIAVPHRINTKIIKLLENELNFE